MRQIKYRAWVYDESNEQYSMWYSDEPGTDLSTFFSVMMPLRDKDAIMQYTGLKDKNGQEIYESDIVDLHHFIEVLGENYGVSEGEREIRGAIKIKPFGLFIDIIGENNEHPIMMIPGIHEESFEVIGNTYQNEDLL